MNITAYSERERDEEMKVWGRTDKGRKRERERYWTARYFMHSEIYTILPVSLFLPILLGRTQLAA
uniref:MFS transporter n=1 Tax=Heterorhabditis bacteriophora TaxID=37862 RepID=A0A1I7WN04_HETBA